nr:aldo/keto reductase [Streptomyces natalensis]
MKYRQAGDAGPLLPVVSLGLWQRFGEDGDPLTQRAIIRGALELGVNHFDLANNYGPPPGGAEIRFGKVLQSDLKRQRDSIIISTKAGYPMWPGPHGAGGTRKHLLASLDQSLGRMGLDYVDIFYSHRRDMDTPLEETMSALALAVRQGKARHAGISSYNVADTHTCIQIARRLNMPTLIHQPSYSIVNRWIEEDGLLDALGKERVGCVSFAPMAQGLLSNRYLQGISRDSRAALGKHPKPKVITVDFLDRLSLLQALADRRGQTLAQLSISWALKDQRVTSTAIGVSSVAQLRENVDAINSVQFTTGDLSEIDDLFLDWQMNMWRP